MAFFGHSRGQESSWSSQQELVALCRLFGKSQGGPKQLISGIFRLISMCRAPLQPAALRRVEALPFGMAVCS